MNDVIATETRDGRRRLVECTFDRGKNILFIAHPAPVTLSTSKDLDAYCNDIRDAWYRLCNGRRVYGAVDLTNLLIDIDLSLFEYFATRVRTVAGQCAITHVRYGGTLLQRTTSRMAAIRRRERSNICRSRDEAIALVQALQETATRPSGGYAI